MIRQTRACLLACLMLVTAAPLAANELVIVPTVDNPVGLTTVSQGEELLKMVFMLTNPHGVDVQGDLYLASLALHFHGNPALGGGNDLLSHVESLSLWRYPADLTAHSQIGTAIPQSTTATFSFSAPDMPRIGIDDIFVVGIKFQNTATPGQIIQGFIPAGGMNPGDNGAGGNTGPGTGFGTFIVIGGDAIYGPDMLVETLPLEILSGPALPEGTASVPYDFQFLGEGGAPPYAWSMDDGLPPGWELSADGQLTAAAGVVEEGSWTFEVTLTDSHPAGSETVTALVTLEVVSNGAPLTITTDALPDATRGHFYSFALAATGGGPGDRVWSAEGLPSGVGIDAETGELTAVMVDGVAGGYDITVSVEDSYGIVVIKALDLEVLPAPALAFVTESLPGGNIGSSWQGVIMAQGGAAAGDYHWSLEGGSLLPQGIEGLPAVTEGPSLTLSGEPLATGLQGFSVRVTDDLGDSTIREFSVMVSGANFGGGSAGGGAGCVSGGGGNQALPFAILGLLFGVIFALAAYFRVRTKRREMRRQGVRSRGNARTTAAIAGVGGGFVLLTPSFLPPPVVAGIAGALVFLAIGLDMAWLRRESARKHES